MAADHREHRQRDERPEYHDDDVDVKVGLDHGGVGGEHDQDRHVFVEVLHRDRMARRQQHVAAVLQQRVHRHDEKPGHRADENQHPIYDREARYEDHGDDHHAHRDAGWQHVQRPLQRDESPGEHRAERDADRSHALEHGALVERQAQVGLGPREDDELQRRTRAPEQRGDRELNLPELVFPGRREAVVEIAYQQHRIGLLVSVTGAGVRDEEVEYGGDDVDSGDHQDGGFRRGFDAGVDMRHVDC